MTIINTINGTFKGELIEKSKLPRTAKTINFSYLKLEGLYNFDPFTEITQYSTEKKTYLTIKVTN